MVGTAISGKNQRRVHNIQARGQIERFLKPRSQHNHTEKTEDDGRQARQEFNGGF